MKKITYGLLITAAVIIVALMFSLTKCENQDATKGQTTSGVNQETGDESDYLGDNITSAPQQTTENGTAGIVEEGLQSDGCNDANCEAPGVCYQGRCKVPECSVDADCADEDPCTPDLCQFAGHPNGFCSTDVITLPRNNDGCCPVGADVDKDTDCAPVCGNHKCEYGETTNACPDDCKNAGPRAAEPAPSEEYPGDPT